MPKEFTDTILPHEDAHGPLRDTIKKIKSLRRHHGAREVHKRIANNVLLTSELNPEDLVIYYDTVGVDCTLANYPIEAREHHESALAQVEKMGDANPKASHTRARIFRNIANTYLHTPRPEPAKALPLIEAALEQHDEDIIAFANDPDGLEKANHHKMITEKSYEARAKILSDDTDSDAYLRQLISFCLTTDHNIIDHEYEFALDFVLHKCNLNPIQRYALTIRQLQLEIGTKNYKAVKFILANYAIKSVTETSGSLVGTANSLMR
jgi:hypothetical protein